MTLAVGDGINDVNMIKAADVGVGILGKEGLRAAMSSDFAICEFKFLWRLLFFHGRLNYFRISTFVLYFFYKNFIFTFPHLFYAFYCGYSGYPIFDDYYISFYNLFFTALPVMVRAVIEIDLSTHFIIERKSQKHLIKCV